MDLFLKYKNWKINFWSLAKDKCFLIPQRVPKQMSILQSDWLKMGHFFWDTLYYQVLNQKYFIKSVYQANCSECGQKYLNYSKTCVWAIFNRPGPKAGSIHGIEVCVCMYVCMLSVPSPYIFSRCLIGPQITWPDPGLSLAVKSGM